MRRSFRHAMTLGLLLGGVIASDGCSHRLGPVQATQNGGGIGSPNLPDISVELSKECMAIDGRQLAARRTELNSNIVLEENGQKVIVTLDGIPDTAPDFATCMRLVLHELPIAEQPFRDALNSLKFLRKHANDSDDAFIEFLRTIPGVTMMDTELVLEADGYTVALDVKVNVVANPESVIDDNNRTVGKLGMMALASLGYDEIMSRAEQQGWVRTVRRSQRQSPAKKALVGDAATAATEFGRIMSRGLVYAGISSQLDTPAPGIGDAIGVGIIAGALLIAGAVAVNELLTATATTTTAPPAATATATPTPTTTTITTAAPTTTTTSPPVAISRRCLPCLPIPVGETAYEYHSAAAGNEPHNGMANHTHHFQMNQSPPAAGCRCFWKRNFIEPTPEFSPLPGAVPVSPAAGGGIAP